MSAWYNPRDSSIPAIWIPLSSSYYSELCPAVSRYVLHNTITLQTLNPSQLFQTSSPATGVTQPTAAAPLNLWGFPSTSENTMPGFSCCSARCYVHSDLRGDSPHLLPAKEEDTKVYSLRSAPSSESSLFLMYFSMDRNASQTLACSKELQLQWVKQLRICPSNTNSTLIRKFLNPA